MEMILIGQERVTMITKTMKHHTDHTSKGTKTVEKAITI